MTQRTRAKVEVVKELFAAAFTYPQMQAVANVGDRRLRQLLDLAGIDDRKAGRPRKTPPGKRVGYEFAGVL